MRKNDHASPLNQKMREFLLEHSCEKKLRPETIAMLITSRPSPGHHPAHRLSEPGHGPLRQPAEVRPAPPSGHLQHRLLQEKAQGAAGPLIIVVHCLCRSRIDNSWYRYRWGHPMSMTALMISPLPPSLPSYSIHPVKPLHPVKPRGTELRHSARWLRRCGRDPSRRPRRTASSSYWRLRAC